MSIRQISLGSEIKQVFSAPGSPSAYLVIKDGVLYPSSVEILPIAGADGWFTASIVPVETGVYVVIVEGVEVGTFEVVTKDVFSFLRDLEDQAFGGWEWDKSTTVMTLYRQDGSILSRYECSDGLEAGYSRPILSQ